MVITSLQIDSDLSEMALLWTSQGLHVNEVLRAHGDVRDIED